MDWTKSAHSGALNCVEWRKSTYSSNDGSCVEYHVSSHCHGDGCVAVATDTPVIKVRDSKDKEGPVLTFTPKEWDAFVRGVKDGEFDLALT
jgi:hypothetical protein